MARHANPNEVDLGFRYIMREFANLWIARFSGELSCECFNLFGEHWIGGHRQTQSVTARVQCGAGLACLVLGPVLAWALARLALIFRVLVMRRSSYMQQSARRRLSRRFQTRRFRFCELRPAAFAQRVGDDARFRARAHCDAPPHLQSGG